MQTVSCSSSFAPASEQLRKCQGNSGILWEAQALVADLCSVFSTEACFQMDYGNAAVGALRLRALLTSTGSAANSIITGGWGSVG